MSLREEVEIRSLHTTTELEEVRRLESHIWGEGDSVPSHQTITAVKNGGLVLGAFFGEKLIAFQYSFPGFKDGRVYLCSHILGTDPSYRNQGIGEQLKQAQRAEALKLGYSLITWTYDPLESINGYLNIAKLGGVSSTYIENCYGEMDDLLNSGISTDRLLVEWHIGSETSNSSQPEVYDDEFITAHSVLNWALNDALQPVASFHRACNHHSVQFIPIPKDYRTIRHRDIALARDWRVKTRDAFLDLFAKGYQLTGFKKVTDHRVLVNYYVLVKGVPTIEA